MTVCVCVVSLLGAALGTHYSLVVTLPSEVDEFCNLTGVSTHLLLGLRSSMFFTA